jgi:hypothetical protein
VNNSGGCKVRIKNVIKDLECNNDSTNSVIVTMIAIISTTIIYNNKENNDYSNTDGTSGNDDNQ